MPDPLPGPARRAYDHQWRPAYAALDAWPKPLRADPALCNIGTAQSPVIDEERHLAAA